MKYWILNHLIEVLIVSAILALIVGAPLLDRAVCTAKWEGSGTASKWGLLSGCMVRRADGTWIPSENMRDVSQ